MPLRGDPTLNPSRLRWAVLAPLAAAALVACGGGGGSNSSGADGGNGSNSSGEQTASTCPETGTYACKSGETEPLYTFQWALNYVSSWFMNNADQGAYGGGMDLNVEPVHRQGIKGQGVNVLVIDTGVDLAHEDLKDNAAYDMSWNYATNSDDPSPLLTPEPGAHGTMVAGIIGAAQNGKGIMGIAPQAKLGGVPLIETGQDSTENFADAFGGAAWSQRAHIINGSFGGGIHPIPYARPGNPLLASIQSLKALRDGKGVVFVKSAGNSFNYAVVGGNQLNYCGPLRNSSACINPGNDSMGLPPNVILTAALNAKGQASNYSSSGSVVWITGLAGEHGAQGSYGEKSGLSPEDIASGRTGDGPTLFSTDIRGCAQGSSRNVNNSGTDFINTAFMRGESVRKDVKDNPNCDYAYMNGTSAAAPSITGVVALMLSANPDLTWRDVRDILRLSARALDQGYEQRKRSDINATLPTPYNALFDLKTNTLLTQSGGAEQIKVGSTQAPLELGWTTNSAGLKHSNWYGFGVPDAAKAVELAKLYQKEPARSKPAAQAEPDFTTVKKITSFEYQTTTLLGEYDAGEQTVDAFQLRLTGANICLGSLGLAVESPSGTKSLLKMPLDNFAQQGISSFTQYGAGSYAFYGENAKGKWKIYAIASNPVQDPSAWSPNQLLPRPCPAAPAAGSTIASNATLTVEARVIAQ